MRKRKCVLIGGVFLCIVLFAGCGRSEKVEIEPSSDVVSADVVPAEEVPAEEVPSGEPDDKISSEMVRNAYMDFLDGAGTIKTAECFREDDADGNIDYLLYGEYTLSELQEAIAEAEGGESTVQYAFWGYPDERELMFLCFKNRDSLALHWTGIIRYEDDGPVLAGSYEAGYRSEATLYDTGYLVYQGSGGAGDYETQLIRIDDKGDQHVERSLRELWSSYAVSWIYEIDPEGNGPEGDYSALSTDFMMRTCVTPDKKYLCVDNSDNSTSEAALIEELSELGVSEISREKMDELFDLSEYTGSEIVWNVANGQETTVAEEPVSVSYGDESELSGADDQQICILDESEYRVIVKLDTTEEIRDLKIYRISMDYIEDEICFWGEELYEKPEMVPGTPFYIQLSFPGDSPSTGISYVDSSNETRYFTLMMSGYDGSLVLDEEKPFR